MHYSCPEILENDTYGSCFWDIKTNPHYRLPYEYYYFTLNAKNVFGNWSKQIEFHHYSHGKLLVNCHTFYVISNHSCVDSFHERNILLLMYVHDGISLVFLENQKCYLVRENWPE